MQDPTDARSTPDIPPESPATDQQQASEAPLSQEGRTSPSTGLMPMPLSGTIQSLQEAGVRGSGMLLLQVITSRLESDLAVAREELRGLRAELRDCERDCYEQRERVSVLRERLKNADRIRWLQSGALTFGGIVAAVSVEHLGDQRAAYAIAGIVLAGVLLLVGWIPFRPSRES